MFGCGRRAAGRQLTLPLLSKDRSASGIGGRSGVEIPFGAKQELLLSIGGSDLASPSNGLCSIAPATSSSRSL
jgi:hypothetical protein